MPRKAPTLQNYPLEISNPKWGNPSTPNLKQMFYHVLIFFVWVCSVICNKLANFRSWIRRFGSRPIRYVLESNHGKFCWHACGPHEKNGKKLEGARHSFGKSAPFRTCKQGALWNQWFSKKKKTWNGLPVIVSCLLKGGTISNAFKSTTVSENSTPGLIFLDIQR